MRLSLILHYLMLRWGPHRPQKCSDHFDETLLPFIEDFWDRYKHNFWENRKDNAQKSPSDESSDDIDSKSQTRHSKADAATNHGQNLLNSEKSSLKAHLSSNFYKDDLKNFCFTKIENLAFSMLHESEHNQKHGIGSKASDEGLLYSTTNDLDSALQQFVSSHGSEHPEKQEKLRAMQDNQDHLGLLEMWFQENFPHVVVGGQKTTTGTDSESVFENQIDAEAPQCILNGAAVCLATYGLRWLQNGNANHENSNTKADDTDNDPESSNSFQSRITLLRLLAILFHRNELHYHQVMPVTVAEFRWNSETLVKWSKKEIASRKRKLTHDAESCAGTESSFSDVHSCGSTGAAVAVTEQKESEKIPYSWEHWGPPAISHVKANYKDLGCPENIWLFCQMPLSETNLGVHFTRKCCLGGLQAGHRESRGFNPGGMDHSQAKENNNDGGNDNLNPDLADLKKARIAMSSGEEVVPRESSPQATIYNRLPALIGAEIPRNISSNSARELPLKAPKTTHSVIDTNTQKNEDEGKKTKTGKKATKLSITNYEWSFEELSAIYAMDVHENFQRYMEVQHRAQKLIEGCQGGDQSCMHGGHCYPLDRLFKGHFQEVVVDKHRDFNLGSRADGNGDFRGPIVRYLDEDGGLVEEEHESRSEGEQIISEDRVQQLQNLQSPLPKDLQKTHNLLNYVGREIIRERHYTTSPIPHTPPPFSMLQIGVCFGQSLAIWERYFSAKYEAYFPVPKDSSKENILDKYPNLLKIDGLDLFPERYELYNKDKMDQTLDFGEDRVRVFRGDSTNLVGVLEFEAELKRREVEGGTENGITKSEASELQQGKSSIFQHDIRKSLQYDIIVDDGDHSIAAIERTFDNFFFRFLKPGGVYVIEDFEEFYGREKGVGVKESHEERDNAKLNSTKRNGNSTKLSRLEALGRLPSMHAFARYGLDRDDSDDSSSESDVTGESESSQSDVNSESESTINSEKKSHSNDMASNPDPDAHYFSPSPPTQRFSLYSRSFGDEGPQASDSRNLLKKRFLRKIMARLEPGWMPERETAADRTLNPYKQWVGSVEVLENNLLVVRKRGGVL